MISFAEWQASHTPAYVTAVRSMQMQRQIKHEIEDRRYNAQMEMYRQQAEGQQAQIMGMIAIERIKGENELQKIEAELEAKIKLLDAEEDFKNLGFFRDSLSKQTDFEYSVMMEIAKAKIARKTGASAHIMAMEMETLKQEHLQNKEKIDELVKRSIALAEIESKKVSDEAATNSMNRVIAMWNSSAGQ